MVVLVATAAPTALAAGGGAPLVQERFDDEFVEEPDLFVDVCGVEVRTVTPSGVASRSTPT